jgi:hypothetical protein
MERTPPSDPSEPARQDEFKSRQPRVNIPRTREAPGRAHFPEVVANLLNSTEEVKEILGPVANQK